MADRWGLPSGLRLNGQRVVVVGGGVQALRAAVAALDAGGSVVVLARTCTPTLADLAAAGRLRWKADRPSRADLDDAWLVLLCTDDPEACTSLASIAAEQGIAYVLNDPAPARSSRMVRSAGHVVLVGGGPGDPALITVRGRQALADADVVIFDRLAPLSLLADLAPGVEIIDAAKVPGAPGMSQDEINDLLVARAQAGHVVVRLKGGDPFVFGRGMEEMLACAAAGVPVQVVPGVTSAVAGPALAGIPVTHRGLAQAFTVVSGHVPPGDPASTVDWRALAVSGSTLVVLMGVETMPSIAKELRAGGLPGTTPVACLVQASTPASVTHLSNLEEVAHVILSEGVRPPAIFVVGAVVEASDRSTTTT
jgi:uroporphyrin-III C-methyltransferase/precorrin-2 dehydrogenase/sirohydrochlorin ferrochelatase